MSDTKVFLELSEEIQKTLFENRISLREILDSQGIVAEIAHEIPCYQTEEGARSKDPATVIVASGAAIFLISLAISNILKTIYRKPYLVEYFELVEIKDKEGNLLLDNWNNPQFKLTKKFELIEPREEDSYRTTELNWKYLYRY